MFVIAAITKFTCPFQEKLTDNHAGLASQWTLLIFKLVMNEFWCPLDFRIQQHQIQGEKAFNSL